MKNALIFFLFGALTVIAIAHFYQERKTTPTADASSLATTVRTTASDVAAQTRETAGRVKDTVANKLEDWHLTPDEIKTDLAKTGQVVRTKAHAAGEAISDARIVTVIKAKYVLDRDLSALDISVTTNTGEVRLAGAVASPELIGRAVQLALDTDGVTKVTATLSASTAAKSP